MGFFRHVRNYLWKNAIERRTTLFGSVCEVLCPLILVGLMVLLFTVIPRNNFDQEIYASQVAYVDDFPFQSLQYQLGVSGQRFGMAPKGSDLDKFLDRMDTLYPAVNLLGAFDQQALHDAGVNTSAIDWQIPKFSDVVMQFDTEADMDTYCSARDYATTPSTTPLLMGVVFDSFGFTDNEWAYRIRLNSSSTPSTSGSQMNTFARQADVFSLLQYFGADQTVSGSMSQFSNTPGFAQVQTALDRAIINKQGPASSADSRATDLVSAMIVATIINANTPARTIFALDKAVNPASATVAQLVSPITMLPQSIGTAAFPTPAFSTNPFYEAAKDVFALFFVLTLLVPVSRLIRGMVHEKETRIREGMKMMGMTDAALNTAWFITYWLVFLLIAIGAMLLTMGNMFGHSNPLYIFALFFLFGLATTMCCFMIASFFSRSKTAAVLGMMIFFALFFPKYGLHSDTGFSGVAAASLCCPVAFGLAIDAISEFENNGVGLTANTIDTEVGNITFTWCLIMLAIDCVVYFVLGWYFGQVWPSEFGVRRKPWFLCTKRYWVTAEPKADRAGSLLENLVAPGDSDNVVLEEVGDDLRSKEANHRCLKVRGLYKRFDTPDGVKTAVNNLNLTMYEGEIFCLLGHNGAGKSTTISMLTGLISPSDGEATIFGKDIGVSMDELRQSMGVCPQHNVLFDNLTVMQHLQYFASLKGMEASRVDAACVSMIQEVGLVEKTHNLSSQLSGGQKRKLSVAIALIGDSKVVFLDEPTSGMDPYSRRSTWQVLQNNRSNRIIVLTTHFMDEADLLGDRIGIMDAGSIRCCGSPMFLKSRYGVGYNLTAVKEAGCNPMVVTDVITRHVPDATTLSNVGAEISFQLPLDQSSAFPAMLTELDDNLDNLKLETYGISVTTMEEVFLKVAQIGDHAFRERQQSKRSGSLTGLTAPRPLSGGVGTSSGAGAGATAGGKPGIHGDVLESKPSARGSLRIAKGVKSDSALIDVGRPRSAQPSIRTRASQALFCSHFRALFQKRVRYFMRDKKAIAFQLLIPSIAIFFGMLLLKVSSGSSAPPVMFNTLRYNPSLGYENPTPYLNGSDLAAATTLGAIPVANRTLHPLSPAEVMSHYRTVNPSAGSNCQPTCTQEFKYLEAFSEYLLSTRGSFRATRYFAAMVSGTPTAPQPVANVLFLQNTTSVDAGPLFINLVDSALLRLSSGNTKAVITTYNDPLAKTWLQDQASQRIGALFAAIMIVFFMAFIPAAFIVFIVREREVSAKHQQLISGVSIPAYWVSSLTYDCITYIMPAAIALIIIKGFDIAQFVDDGTFPATLLLFALYGPASAAFVYMLSFLFKSHSMAQNIVLLLNLIAVILMLVSSIMEFIPSTQHANSILEWFYLLLPGYALGAGLLNLALRASLKALFNYDDAPFAYDITGRPLLFLALSIPVYFLIALGIDIMLSYPSIRAAIFRDPTVTDKPIEEDEDVAAETRRVDTPGTEKDDAIRLSHMRKVYRNKKVAVRDLTFGIRHGECFGFLGINGAGKTTTLKMLSGDEIRTSGVASLMGFDILKEQVKVRRLLGYCPQFDALLDLLTVREHLELFAKIKGVSADRVERVVADKLTEMDLGDFENKKAGSLSGGNKRKLSVAIAMMGNPPLMFLDEPSTGMDPVARRFMWKVIAEMAKTSSIVLVSHSMEECEALCNRVGIMVGGRMRCLGTIQHLKDRFGQGYLAEIKMGALCDEEIEEVAQRMDVAEGRVTFQNLQGVCAALGDESRSFMVTPMGPGWRINAGFSTDGFVTTEEFARWWAAETAVAHVAALMTQQFPGAVMTERHGDSLSFKLPKRADMRLSDMFGRIEFNKAAYNIAEYSLSQTSLEQIFNEFASQQEEEKGAVRGMAAPGQEASAGGNVAPPPAEAPFRVRHGLVAAGAGATAGMAVTQGRRDSFSRVLAEAGEGVGNARQRVASTNSING